MGFHKFVISTVAVALGIGSAGAVETPVIPVGSDAYRMWDRWANQRVGVRAYMRSTYDRQGGNERADAAHVLYQLAPDYNVTLDVQGRGILYFVRYNHWHGSPWHYDVDGKKFVVTETSTPDPLHPAPGSIFEPAAAFPKPLTFTWADTKGAELSWVPIGFNDSFRMAYSRTFYGTGYYIYHQFVEGTKLSQPIRSWTPETRPDEDVLKLINRAGTDLADKKTIKGPRSESGKLELAGEKAVPVWTKSKPGVIRALDFSIPQTRAKAFSRARLRIVWDDRSEPSVDVPISLFYGAGTLYNRDNREFLVKSFPMVIRYADGRIHLACYLPMPFFKSARIELTGDAGETIPDVEWNVRYAPLRAQPADLGYFHATYRDFPTPEPGKDLVLLNTTEAEGGGDWSGQFIGTSFIFSHAADLRTLEGDPRFFFDDSQTPQAHGTGTEEWGGGGDYWGGLNMTLPFAGHPLGARNSETAVSEEDRIESAYRFLLADLMPFGRNARIQLEHGGVNESTQHYETIAYWYGLPAPSLLKTDELSVGDKDSEEQHRYSSPGASAWQLAGVWYLAGSNTCVFSNPPPKDELGATQHIVETSNRRFRDDEFLLPLKLTKGRSSIRVRVKFTPVNIPLYPGYNVPETAWSEIRYTAYSFVRPHFSAPR